MKFKLKSDENRKITINTDIINAYTERYIPETEFEIEVVRRKKKKSLPMQKYYFSTVLPIFMEHLGYERDEQLIFHRQLKIVYFQVQPDKRNIYREKDIPSVFGENSELGIDIKQKFVSWVKRKAAHEGVYVPDPNES